MNPDTEFDAELMRGAALFNAGRYFAAHEAWELIWRGAQGSDRAILQGLIQSAAAMLHRERGNIRGADRLWVKARGKLAIAPAAWRGFAIDEFRRALDRYFAAPGDRVGDESRLVLRRID